ncbi:hypothetical protein CR513_08785, partial [Mucuna pruriens]
MDGDDDPSALAWLWVIEALSTFKEITTSTLQGLIDAAPVEPDQYSKNLRELVALRCLEELSTRVVDPSYSSTLDSRVGFNFSRGCEDVLQEILGEIPLSNLKMAGAELSKWDVYPFIEHKRAGTFKCHLEQLRESIFEGTHPHTDYLKERSGLFPRNSGYTVLVNDGKSDDHSDKDVGNSTDAENMGQKENSVSLILENGDKSSKEHLLDNNCSPSKRSRVYSADDHLKGHLHEKQVYINESDDFFRNSKRIKCYASTSFESKKEKPVSQLREEVSEHLTERILISEHGEHHAENNNKEALGDGSLEDSHNGCTASKLCQSSSHIEVFRDESNNPFNDTSMSQHTFGGENSQQLQVESIPHIALPDEIQHKISGSKPSSERETDLQLEDSNGSQQQIASVKAPDHTGNGCGVEITGDIVYQGEKINLVMEKQAEKSICLKCNEGDQFLICDANVVQPAVSENCLGLTTTVMPQHTSVAEPYNNTSMDESDDTAHSFPDDIVAEPCNNASMDETDDTANHAIPTNDANAEKNQHMINLHQPEQKGPDITSLNLSQKPVASDKTIVDMVNGCGEELSSDSDGYHNEKNYLEAKKHEFLRSHCTVDQDFSAMTESTEQNLCVKCNEGGQLLACKTTTCPLMVHKNCLDASSDLDAEGNSFCPFCAYSHAISEYLEAKKKASLARKELAIFISKGIQNQAAELVHEFHRQEHCFSRKSSKCEHIHVKNNGNDQLTGCEDNREDQVGEHANEANNLKFERSQQQAPISCIHSSCREKENVSNGLVEVLRGEEEIGEMPNAKSLTSGRVEENEVPTDHVDGHVGDKFTCDKTNIALVNQSNAGEEVPQEMTKQHNIDGTIEPVCPLDSGKEEISDESEKHSTPRYSMRFRKHETQ